MRTSLPKAPNHTGQSEDAKNSGGLGDWQKDKVNIKKLYEELEEVKNKLKCFDPHTKVEKKMDDIFSAGLSHVKNLRHENQENSQPNTDGKFNMSDLYLVDSDMEKGALRKGDQTENPGLHRSPFKVAQPKNSEDPSTDHRNSR